MSKIAGIGKIGRERLSRILESNPPIVTSELVASILNISRKEASRSLYRWNKNGWVQRVKRGVYIPVPLGSTSDSPVIENPYFVADSIYSPGYIGGFSAVKHWDLTEQIIETTYYFTSKQVKDRSPSYNSTTFKIKTIKPNKIFGLKSIWMGSKKVFISDPTKTLIDIIEDPKLVGGMRIVEDIYREYLDSDYFNLEKIIEYAMLINNRTVMKRLGFLTEATHTDKIPYDTLCLFQSEISSGYSFFDTTTKGNLTNDKWKLKITKSWKKQYDRKK
ncbi:MAG: type IV toxin-antitoxin system AbiEi family antitoxin domain-containing protein [Porticoccus sp.]|nr:type IV toxin-antitoxin system AbiEi family antitoxin domain-containing protein [Porticoccus sp.]MBQ0807352.1 type IV toxin-antitoxin system AbiEi family antitoxin domain-containing protein [Porticoccus sp.]